MNWSGDIVRARFIEAADTESRMPSAGAVVPKGGYWPGYTHSIEDMNGWGTKRLAEERQMQMARIPPSAAAISRFEQVIGWAPLVADDRRRLVWGFARSRSRGTSFAEWCRRRGLNRVTAYQRLARQFDAIADQLNRNSVPLQLPDGDYGLQVQGENGTNASTLPEAFDDHPGVKSPRAVILPGGNASDLLKTPADLTRFAKHLKAVNRLRRKMRGARRLPRSKVRGGA